jgi:hypothetical protein
LRPLLNFHNKKDEMGGACSTNGGGYWWESQKERDHWEDRRRCVDNIKMYLREIGWDAVDWIDMAEDRAQ